MTPVEQNIIDKGRGDCMRACAATLLDLPLEAVPNFTDLPHWLWHNVFIGFYYSVGWDYIGQTQLDLLEDEVGFDGYFKASVDSKNYENTWHAVVIDRNGLVVHDPNPNKQYQGQQLTLEDVKSVDLFRPREDENWKAMLDYREALIAWEEKCKNDR